MDHSSCIFLTVFIALYIPSSLANDLVYDLDSKDAYLQFREQDLPQGIFYYHHQVTAEFTSRTKVMMKQAEAVLQDKPTFMKFGTVNCLTEGMEDIDICTQRGKRKYYAYKPKSEPKRFSLRTFHNADAFIAFMVNFVYEEEISSVADLSEWNKLEMEMKGNKDILLMYFSGLGSEEHYTFKMNFLVNRQRENIKYAFTNNKDFASQLGGHVGYAKCSIVDASYEKPCPYTTSQNKVYLISEEGLSTFIELQAITNVARFNEKIAKKYSELKNVHVLYIFVETDEQFNMVTKMANDVIEKFSFITIRVLIADRRIHPKIMMEEYGITDSTILPTAMLRVIPKEDNSKEGEDLADLTVLEPFTPDEDFVVDSLIKFIDNVAVKKDIYFKSVADVFYINCIKSEDWKGFNSIEHDTLIGYCSNSEQYRETCLSFNQNFRRIVRTMYTAGLLNFDYIYIDGSHENQIEEFNVVPGLAIVHQGKIIKFANDLDGDTLLNAVNGKLKMNMPLLPFSGSDLLFLPVQSRINENGDIMVDGENEDLSNMQEDEIGLFVSRMKNSKFFEDENTLKLTDNTFEKTINMTDLLLVFFISPESDDVSYLIQPVIKSINSEVAKDAHMTNVPAKVAIVYCESEYLVCKSIHSYPTLRFYSKGTIISTYNGMMDQENILNALALIQQPHLQKLSDDSIWKYQEPSMKKTSLSILGWFASDNADFQIFNKVANEYRGMMQFSYSMGETASKIETQGHGSHINQREGFVFMNMLPETPESTLLSAFIRGEKSRSYNGGVKEFSELGMRAFLKTAAIPKFGELNMENFPAYKATQKPLLVLFTSGNKIKDSVTWNIILQVVKDDSLENQVYFTWMDTDNDITKDIRRSYLGTQKEKQADIVIVNHTKGEVYHYSGPQDAIEGCSQEVAQWIRNCADGAATAKSHLKVMKWKPLREGFDFLHLIDSNQIRFGVTKEDMAKSNMAEREEEENERKNKLLRKEVQERLRSESDSSQLDNEVINTGEELDEAELADSNSEAELAFTHSDDDYSETIDLGPSPDIDEFSKDEL